MSFRINLFKTVLIVSVLNVVLFLNYAFFFIFPLFTDHILNNVKQLAVKNTRHLSRRMGIQDHEDITQIDIKEEYGYIIQRYMEDLNIYKTRFFSISGEIIFSTEASEIGEIKTAPYFKTIVNKQIPYIKAVSKKIKKTNDTLVQKELVECYVPLIYNGKTIGVIELYYDIGSERAALDRIQHKILWTITPVSFIFLILIIIVSLKAGANFTKLKLAEKKLKKTNEDIEAKIKNRTNELMLMNQALQHEVKERKQYEEQVMLAANVFENTIEAIMITDRLGHIIRVNNAFTNITGYQPKEVLGKNPKILKSERHDKLFYKKMWASLRKYNSWEGEIWNRRKDGQTYPEWLSVNAIDDEKGKPAYYVALFHDISDLKKNEKLLKYQANYDPLTALPNRQLFNDRLKSAVAHCERESLPMSLLFCDLDDFKNINDTQGHYFGDLLLKEVGNRLVDCCRKDDTVARLGGDEFAIICPFIKSDETASATLAKRILDAFKKPFCIEQQKIYAHISIGITRFPEDGKDIESLIKNADVAMYRSKRKGKNRFSFYTPDMSEAVLRKLGLSNDLRSALDRREFMVFYQPKVNIQTGLVSGMEALLRWMRRGDEFVSPAEFIPLAEDNGTIYNIGQWVMEQACREILEFSQICGQDLKIAVNLSVKQFSQKDLIEQIQNILEKTKLPPHLLTIEITENIVIQDIESTIQVLKKLNRLGIRVSIDDFGTGYSSLTYLKKLPITELKVDKTFVDDTPGDQDACAIVNTVISLAKNLNLQTVAEGVEEKDQLAFLKSIGCDELQGYYYCRPLSRKDMEQFLVEDKQL